MPCCCCSCTAAAAATASAVAVCPLQAPIPLSTAAHCKSNFQACIASGVGLALVYIVGSAQELNQTRVTGKMIVPGLQLTLLVCRREGQKSVEHKIISKLQMAVQWPVQVQWLVTLLPARPCSDLLVSTTKHRLRAGELLMHPLSGLGHEQNSKSTHRHSACPFFSWGQKDGVCRGYWLAVAVAMKMLRQCVITGLRVV